MATTIPAGWYGYDFDAVTERLPWEAFLLANRQVVLQRTTWQTHEWIAVLIEVRQPVIWSFPGGLPRPAPKGFATKLQDLTQAPDPSPGFVTMVEELTGTVYAVFRRTGKVAKEVAGGVASAASSASSLVYVVAFAAIVWAVAGRR
jgi:hypothetical protein